MNANVRTALGWVAAVFVNVGGVLFVVGILLPRVDGVPVLAVGITLCVLGLVAGGFWLAASRR